MYNVSVDALSTAVLEQILQGFSSLYIYDFLLGSFLVVGAISAFSFFYFIWRNN